jgi:hypothetical protein
LIYIEETDIFRSAYYEALEEVETQEDLRELLMLTAEYLNAVDKEKEEKIVIRLLEEQKGRDLKEKLSPADGILFQLKNLSH